MIRLKYKYLFLLFLLSLQLKGQDVSLSVCFSNCSEVMQEPFLVIGLTNDGGLDKDFSSPGFDFSKIDEDFSVDDMMNNIGRNLNTRISFMESSFNVLNHNLNQSLNGMIQFNQDRIAELSEFNDQNTELATNFEIEKVDALSESSARIDALAAIPATEANVKDAVTQLQVSDTDQSNIPIQHVRIKGSNDFVTDLRGKTFGAISTEQLKQLAREEYKWENAFKEAGEVVASGGVLDVPYTLWKDYNDRIKQKMNLAKLLADPFSEENKKYGEKSYVTAYSAMMEGIRMRYFLTSRTTTYNENYVGVIDQQKMALDIQAGLDEIPRSYPNQGLGAEGESVPCNHFLDYALRSIYGVEDFYSPENGTTTYLANQMYAFMDNTMDSSNPWLHVGDLSNQKFIDDAVNMAAAGHAVVAAWKNSNGHGHVALILPGKPENGYYSGRNENGWTGDIRYPNSASYFLRRDAQGRLRNYVGKKITFAFPKDIPPWEIKIFIRKLTPFEY